VHSYVRRAYCAAILVVCAAIAAACNTSSPVDIDPGAEAAARDSRLVVSPAKVDFGSSATTATVTLKNNFHKNVSWTASENASWLSLGSKSGTLSNSANLSLSATRDGLTPGEYTTDVTVSGGTGSGTEVITVSLAVQAGTFSVSPLKVDFGSTATSASVTLTNSGNKSLTWTASEGVGWLALGSTSGTIAARSKKTVGLKVNRTGRSAGSYSTNVSFSAGTAGSAKIPVTMTVASTSTTTFSVSPLKVDFGSTATSATITLTNSGSTSLTWTASEGVGWLALGSTSGSIAAKSSKTLGLKVNRTGRSAGSYSTYVNVSAGTAGSAKVLVTMTVPSTSTTTFSVSPLKVDFGSTATSATVTLTNSGSTSLTWTANEGVGWLALGSTSGSIAAKSSKTLGLQVSRSGRSAGSYSTYVNVSAGTTGSAKILVTMTVPSTSTSVTLAGQLVDQFDGHALAGLTVQFNGSSATTNSSGQFTIPGSPISSLQQLTISGTGVHRRITYAKTGDSRWGVVPSSFNISAFNDVARDEFGPSTVRWVAPPTVYVDSRPEGFSSSELSTWISQVQTQAAEFISKWSGTKVKPAAVIVTSNPPNDFSAGTVVIHISDNSSDYGGSSTTIGYARLSYQSSGAISGAAVWLRYPRYPGTSGASKRKGILGHELGHAMGLGHMEGSTDSFMEPSIGTNTDLKDFDTRVASLLYTRSPHNSSPDTDSSDSLRGALAPSALPVVREWMCDAGEELAGQ
jgi:predicted small secreted protein